MPLKKLLLGLCLLPLLAGCNIDTSRAVGAFSDIVKGESLSDEDVVALVQKTVEYEDSQHTILGPKTAYGKRLAALTKNLKHEDGLTLNFKVYKTSDINAFAVADGSVRVYSGIMDLMNDDELFFVIGHEIGHVKHGDTKAAIKAAYRVSAVRKAIAASTSIGAAITDSQLGDISEKFINAQFSQQQESAADENGAALMKKYGKKKAAAISALSKLSGEGGAFSSHPGSKERAAVIAAMPDW